MHAWKKYLFLSIIILIFLFLRLYHLRESFNFGSDQGATLLETYNVYQEKKWTLISAGGSSWTSSGRYIFFSSLLYYILMPVLILARWNPLSVSYFLIFLQLVSLVIIYEILTLIHKDRATAAIFAVLFSFSPDLVNYSRFVWSPNFLIPISAMILAFILLLRTPFKKKGLISLFLGLLFAAGFQINYSFILVMAVSMIWIILQKRLQARHFFLMFTAFLIGISPLLLFEFRHDFYNLRTFLLILTQKGKTDSAFRFNDHYILGLIPMVVYFLSVIFGKLKKISRIITFVFIMIFVIYSAAVILPYPKRGFTMVEGWNYPGVKKTASIILSQRKSKYNIVDLLTGDTRAMGLRYLLTIEGSPPMSVTNYPKSEYLFIYSKDPIDKILKGSLWEIDTVKPVNVINRWYIQNGIYLYLVEKVKKND